MVTTKIVYGVVLTPELHWFLKEKSISAGIEFNEYDQETETLSEFLSNTVVIGNEYFLQISWGMQNAEDIYIVGFTLYEMDDYVDPPEYMGYRDGVKQISLHDNEAAFRTELQKMVGDLEHKYYLMLTSA